MLPEKGFKNNLKKNIHISRIFICIVNIRFFEDI